MRYYSGRSSKLSEYLLELYLSSKDHPPARIILDIDATDDPVHGDQQSTFFHGYYENYIFHLLLIYDGDTEELITAVLWLGNVHANRKIVAILQRIVKRLREAFGEFEIVVRADV